MTIQLDDLPEIYEQSIKNYHMLMSRRVKDILVVASLYDACIINQEQRLEERIATLYHHRPPRVTWVHTAVDAMASLDEKDFDLVVTTLQVSDAQASELATDIKSRWARMPVMLLAHAPESVRHLRQAAAPRFLAQAGRTAQCRRT